MRSYAACEDYDPRPSVGDLGPLFEQPQVRKLARRSDPATSKQAAVRIVDGLTQLQRRVRDAFVERGRMTAKVAEQLPEFGDLGFSTVRKRISELATRGLLRDTGEVDAGCTVYEVSEADG